MKRILFLSLALLACGPSPETPAPDYNGAVIPGGSVSLASLVTSSAGTSPVTWSVAPGGGSVTQAGVYTAPTCAQMIAAFTGDLAHSEQVLGISIMPTNPSTSPGGTVQFAVTYRLTCHTATSP